MSNFKNQMAAIAINKSLLKEYQTNNERVVYMDNNTEFQIQLFNPTTDVIGAEISINSTRLSGMIVLKPGERVWLERYLDTAKKFLFSTYEVEDSSVVREAIKNNGEVSIRFYREKKDDRICISSLLNNEWLNKQCTWDTLNINTGISTKDYSDAATFATSAVTTNCLLDAGPDGLPVGTYRSVTASASIPKSFNSSQKLRSAVNSCANSTIETGRIEKGAYSSQSFKTVNNEFESWAFETETIKILPSSRKPYTSSDLQKLYCTECGRKLNQKYKFCPYCGTKVE